MEKDKYLSYDNLTELPNRETFLNTLSLTVENARNSKNTVAVIVIDVDRFCHINNRFNQHIGNQILRSIAERLREWTGNQEKIARIGSDEFGIIIDDKAKLYQIQLVLKDLELALNKPYIISEREVYITSSIGVTFFPNDIERADALIEKAYLALATSKQLGGGNFQLYDVMMEKQEDINLLLEAEIRKAIADGQFINFYQPIICLRTGKIIGAEALVRWQHPQRGLLSPLQFISLCERSGVIVSIDIIVLKAAIEHLKHFASLTPPEFYISVNFSTRHFMLTELYELVSGLLRQTGIDPKKLVVEVTESLLLQNSDIVLKNLELLHSLGINLALDDFGTGYASLSYLKRYPFHLLKIDRSYIREIGRNKNDEVLITAMINMAKNLNQQIVAEGVETQGQIDFLKTNECEYAQGFIFSHPLSFDDFSKKLKMEEFSEGIRRRIL